MASAGGELETEVLQALKRLSQASVREILRDIRRPLAYTTVGTVLDRLYHKKLLTRSRVKGERGLRYVYKFAPDTSLTKRAVASTLKRLVNTFGPSVIPTVYQRLDTISAKEREELKRKIRQKEK